MKLQINRERKQLTSSCPKDTSCRLIFQHNKKSIPQLNNRMPILGRFRAHQLVLEKSALL
ncbi:MAG: hypothetical protein C0456_09130 [Hyphomonas sp.]|nr:hypothetical protein [Hyphomonas sp.]